MRRPSITSRAAVMIVLTHTSEYAALLPAQKPETNAVIGASPAGLQSRGKALHQQLEPKITVQLTAVTTMNGACAMTKPTRSMVAWLSPVGPED